MRTPDEERAYREADRPYVSEQFRDLFDREFYEEFGTYPKESPLYGTRPDRAPDSPRRQAILNLIERGATEGERAAAIAALARFDARSEADDLEAAAIIDQDELDAEEVEAAGEWGL